MNILEVFNRKVCFALGALLCASVFIAPYVFLGVIVIMGASLYIWRDRIDFNMLAHGKAEGILKPKSNPKDILPKDVKVINKNTEKALDVLANPESVDLRKCSFCGSPTKHHKNCPNNPRNKKMVQA